MIDEAEGATGGSLLFQVDYGRARRTCFHSAGIQPYDLFLNEITLSGWADVAYRNTVHGLPVRLTSLYIRIPKTPGTEPGKNDLHYCQRTTASGDCRLRPAGAERSSIGNAISDWAVRLYVSKRETWTKSTTASLGRCT